MKSNLKSRGLKVGCWGFVLGIVMLQTIWAQDQSPQWPEVRFDVYSGTMLDPLPFDTPFLLVGQVPKSIHKVLVRTQLWMGNPVVFGEDSGRMEAFEARLPEALATAPNVQVDAWSVANIRRVQQHFVRVLMDVAYAKKKKGYPFVYAPNTCFDLEGPVSAAVWDFVDRLDKWQRDGTGKEALMDLLLFQARSAQVGFVDATWYAKEPVRWQSHHAIQTYVADSSAVTAASDGSIWNRLQRQFQPGKRTREGDETTFRVMIQPLDANRQYLFDLRMHRTMERQEWARLDMDLGTETQVADMARLAFRIEDVLGGGDLTYGAGGAWKKKIEREIVYRRVAQADTRANGYVGADFGVLHAGDIDQTVLYVGANFYLRPVNKAVPLRLRGGFFRRFAFTVGVTLQGIGDARQTRENLLWSQSLMLGAGYRVSQYIRAGAGVLIFRERNPNTFPVGRDTRLTFTPHVSLSFDVDVGHHLKDLGARIGFGRGDQ